MGGVNFTSASQISEGDEVIILGDIVTYQSVNQIGNGNQLVSLNGITKALTAGTLSATADNANQQLTVTWGAATGTESAISYVVSCGTQSYNATAAGSHTFTMGNTGTFNISVVASADDAVFATATTTAVISSNDVIVLNENFSSITAGNSTSTSGSSSAWNGNSNFPTVSRAYQAGGATRIGASGNPGSITSKSLDLSSSFTISLDIKGWSSVEGTIKVTVGDQTKTITYTETISDSFGTYTLDFNAATNSSTVTIATSAKRAFIDNVVITRHD
jgi:hypothetical protein